VAYVTSIEQLLGAVLSIHVRISPGESIGRLEDRIMRWITQTSTQTSQLQATVVSPAKSAGGKASAADVLWPMRAAFDRLAVEPASTPSFSLCEMMAIVFMFKSLPLLAIPDSSNALLVPAMHSTRGFVLQYYDMCAAANHERKSIGAGAPTAGEGADALYLCLLSLLLHPGDRDLQQRLGMPKIDCDSARDVLHDAAGEDSQAAPATAPAAQVDDIVMVLLSKLEPSGILDRFSLIHARTALTAC
jgi:hypothetical protein